MGELGEAIKKVVADKTMKANVVQLAEKMAKEDGISKTVEIIEKFMDEEVSTGKMKEKIQAYKDKAREKRKKNSKLNQQKLTMAFTRELNLRYPDLRAFNEKAVE